MGALLIVAMLIIPTAAARGLARTPEAMAVIAALIGAVSAVVVLRTAYVLDTPAGPSIVCIAVCFFVFVTSFGTVRNRQA